MSDMPDNKLVKKEETEIVKADVLFPGFAIQSNNINDSAVQKVSKYLPELDEKTRAFGSNNSQTTMTMMSLTMLGGQSTYRMLRQILAEVERRKGSLSECQVTHALLVKAIKRYENKTDPVQQAKYRQACIDIVEMENKINGAFADMATLIDAYNNIKERHNIPDEWDEESFENEEKKHHVRRCFELMYRNMLDSGRISSSTIEYLQQFGVHPQICSREVQGYIAYTDDRIKGGERIHANDLEDFLDEMGNKYWEGADKTSERLFGKKNLANKDFMYKTVTK